MKTALSSFFLIFYFIVLLKPISPFIEYAINKEYLAKVLCINKNKPKMNCEGRCHLKKQLKKVVEEENNPKQNTPPKTENRENLFVNFTKEWQQATINEDKLTFFTRNSNVLSQLLAQPPTPPPKSFHC